MHALFSYRRWIGLALLGGLVACGSAPAPSTDESRRLPPQRTASPPAQTTSPAWGDARDAQGRRIAAHFAAPAGQGQRVQQPDAAGTYRVVLEEVKGGGWRVQDFYQATGNRFSDPFVIKDSADLTRQPVKRIDGWLRQYHHGGGRWLVQLFKDGQAEGTASRYYADGKRQSVIIYRNDRPEGVGTFWHANGATALKVTFRNGQAAVFRGWDESGERMAPEAARAWYERLTQSAR